MKKWVWIYCLISGGLFAQSYDLKEEKEALARIDAAITAGKHAEFMQECNELLDPHRINAFAWYTCGKNLLNVPVTDIKESRANARVAYVRLKRAADDFARTGKQVFYATDAQQYLGLAAMLLSDLDRAQVHFRSVLARDNRIPEAWYNLGVIYELKDLQEESMRAFDRYLRLKNTDAASEF